MEQKPKPTKPVNFIRNIIDEDLKTGKHHAPVTRFPPEPNGFLHIGHAKSICLNFGISNDYPEAHCNLRFDDTNPETEELVFMEAIKKDVHWLGFNWKGDVKFASDYFDKLYDSALHLIKIEKAYVCRLSPEQMKDYRGTLTEPGKESPYRNQSVSENLELFAKMRNGEFAEGSHVLRAKIDMNSGNINMRDPVLYRIKHKPHFKTGDKWCIYPMYDYTHCISDAEEAITHSLCTLEFEDHRPLYDWFLENINHPNRPRQIEFARLNINYTVTSKRKLKNLVEEKKVEGWDDPRLPTISGLRRRGYTPKAIRQFCDQIGISKQDSIIDMSILEECLRNDLNESAPRSFAIIDPLKIVITNYPEDQTEWIEMANHPSDESMGKRKVPFTRSILVEKEDFSEEPPKGFQRLTVGSEVRLRHSYIIKCNEVVRNTAGSVIQLNCTYDPNTLGKKPEGRSVKGIIHWLSEETAIPCQFRLYERLFSISDPSQIEKQDPSKSFLDGLSNHSLTIRKGFAEPSLKKATILHSFQFERLGYFTLDEASTPQNLIWNRSVTLKETWNS